MHTAGSCISVSDHPESDYEREFMHGNMYITSQKRVS